MPDQLTDQEFATLMTEKDPFKLAIRGHTAIEADIDAATAEVFVGDVPGEIRSARFGIRLALAIGLGILGPEDRPLFDVLAKFRNDFAHGKINDLDGHHARRLAHVVRAALLGGESAEAAGIEKTLAEGKPIMSLKIALIFARAAVKISAEAARKSRDDERLIVATHRLLEQRRAGLLEALATEEQAAEQPETGSDAA